MEPIQLTLQTLSEQVITDQIYAVLELRDDYLWYSIQFYCKETDDATGVWEEDVYRDYETFLDKGCVVGCTVSWSHKEGKWYITVRTTSVSLEHYCKDEQEARDISRAIRMWKYGRE